ncbi:hypothetical protein FISHEDRAFT_35146 [Fistulina hepatica ATCC 64428]|uniref:F-box domain-containing protein n=1 Tax=Fistulina hepatica ATCC 64428 TaxID=1128425 RepID=A0A0D7AL49_9AGAR|nr:hypothetical protein FISHEDRAFT_35146 [Fistulina hepatica ATCC 64428]
MAEPRRALGGRFCPELTPELYREIAGLMGTRSDLASLARVSRGFQAAAEYSLYNTLYLIDPTCAMAAFRTLASQPRLAVLVDALTLYVPSDEEAYMDSEDDVDMDVSMALPEGYWHATASALRSMTRLRHLDVQISTEEQAQNAWILDDCSFRLRSFQCDFDWDAHLATFLNSQTDILDLCLLNFRKDSEGAGLSPDALPRLTIFHCPVLDASSVFLRNRPVTHLKTCLSSMRHSHSRATELLAESLRYASKPLRALDIADLPYCDPMELDWLVAASVDELRFLGTLALPVNGEARLRFYASLMRLPYLQCVTLDVSHWTPAPGSVVAFRALADEMRLYKPLIKTVIFVYGEFDRAVMTDDDGLFQLDELAGQDDLWREL